MRSRPGKDSARTVPLLILPFLGTFLDRPPPTPAMPRRSRPVPIATRMATIVLTPPVLLPIPSAQAVLALEIPPKAMLLLFSLTPALPTLMACILPDRLHTIPLLATAHRSIEGKPPPTRILTPPAPSALEVIRMAPPRATGLTVRLVLEIAIRREMLLQFLPVTESARLFLLTLVKEKALLVLAPIPAPLKCIAVFLTVVFLVLIIPLEIVRPVVLIILGKLPTHMLAIRPSFP